MGIPKIIICKCQFQGHLLSNCVLFFSWDAYQHSLMAKHSSMFSFVMSSYVQLYVLLNRRIFFRLFENSAPFKRICSSVSNIFCCPFRSFSTCVILSPNKSLNSCSVSSDTQKRQTQNNVWSMSELFSQQLFSVSRESQSDIDYTVFLLQPMAF